MARIPTVTSQIAARSARTSQGVPSRGASPAAFGAAGAQALQGFGEGLHHVAGALDAFEEKQRNELVSNTVAQADFTRRELEMRNEVGADAFGYQERVLDEYDAWVDQQAEDIEDDEARTRFKERMIAQRRALSSRAAQYELGTAATHSRDQTNASLVALDNKIRLAPDSYDEYISQGFEVLDARTDVPAHVRASMKTKWRQNAALSRFEGALEAATTVDQIETLQAELESPEGKDWTAELSSAGLERVTGLAEAAVRTMHTRADTAARAAISSLETRAADVTVAVPKEELLAVQALVDKSNNPVTSARMARIVRDQDLIHRYRNAPPSAVRDAAERRRNSDPTDFSAYAVEGATRADSFTRMTPNMRHGLHAMLRAADGALGEGLQVYSGYRSPELQAGIVTTHMPKHGFTPDQVAAWNSDVASMGPEAAGVKWRSQFRAKGLTRVVGLPGGSKHQTGQAADLKWNGTRLDQAPSHIRDWVKDNAAQFGLAVPMAHEPWQVEAADARKGSTAVPSDMALYKGAIASIESLGSGGYSAIGPTVKSGAYKGQKAYGKYQVMEDNVYAWTKKYLGRRMTTSEFLADPDAQEKVFEGEFGSYVKRYGDPVKAARAWFGWGEGDGYTSGKEYERRFREYLQNAGTQQAAISAGAYADAATMDRIAKEAEARIAADPMTHAMRTQFVQFDDISVPGAMEARGEQAAQVADYYSIPVSDMKPFTNDETAQLAKTFKDGSADDVLALLTSIQEMGGDMARAGMAQIADVGDVYAYAGGLQMETGQGAVAAEVVRGQKRIDENPDIVRQTGTDPRGLSDAFLNSTGGALMDAAPRQRQAIMDAALAHYVETQVARGRAGAFDADAFAVSVGAVLGGRQGAPALDEVNGARTVMPPGVTGSDMEEAFERMTVADWTDMSEQGEPPRYITGALADPQDLADEAQLRAIGGGRYKVTTSDGSYLITGRPAPNGQLEPYIFAPTHDAVKQIVEREEQGAPTSQVEVTGAGLRPVADDTPAPGDAELMEAVEAVRNEDGSLSAEDITALFEKFGYRAVTDLLTQ